MALALLAACIVAGCSSDDGTCTPGPGCHEPATCGDGLCLSSDGETAENCDKDCSGVCTNDPQQPIHCDSSGPSCNPVGTDCSLPYMECRNNSAWCPAEGLFGACCEINGVMEAIWCPNDQRPCASAPGRCMPKDSTCENPGFCTINNLQCIPQA